MKSSKGSAGKSHFQKGPSSSSSAGAGPGSRKSRWEPDDKPPADRAIPSSDTKPSKPKVHPSASPSVVPPKDNHPPTPPFAPPPSDPRSFPLPDPAGPPPPPAYGFHNLERRTIVLADGNVRSYFALPPDPPIDPAADKFPFGRPGFGLGPEPLPGMGFDKHFPPPPGGRFSPEDFRHPPPFGRGPGLQRDYWDSLGLDGPRGPPEGGHSSLKRKFAEEDEFLWHRQHVMQHGNPNGIPLGPSGSGIDRRDYLGGSPFNRDHRDELRSSKQVKLGGEGYELPPRRMRSDEVSPVVLNVDPQALKSAFFRFTKALNESYIQRKKYLENGKNGPLQCLACGRASKDFADVHELIMHAFSSQNADMRVDHLGLHKALCVLMGWSYSKAPENSKAYQLLSADDAQANREDLILWPPTVIIHNTSSVRRKDGRIEGMGNKEMDNRLKEMGFDAGKSKSIYGKEGHTGITMVKFPNTRAGLKEAERLAEYLNKDNHGRKGWTRVQASQSGNDEKNAALVKVDEKTGERKRVLYGYLATASDLDKIDFDMRKRAIVKGRREFDLSD